MRGRFLETHTFLGEVAAAFGETSHIVGERRMLLVEVLLPCANRCVCGDQLFTLLCYRVSLHRYVVPFDLELCAFHRELFCVDFQLFFGPGQASLLYRDFLSAALQRDEFAIDLGTLVLQTGDEALGLFELLAILLDLGHAIDH